MSKIADLYKSASRTNKLLALVVVLVVLAAGGYAIMRTNAVGFFAFLEPDQGTVSGNATIVNDSSAFNGKAISFNAPPVTTTPPPTSPVDCPAFPAIPDENCTGYKHTGATLLTEKTDDGDGKDSCSGLDITVSPKPGNCVQHDCSKSTVKTDSYFVNCLFTDGFYVPAGAKNVVVQDSFIQGVVSGDNSGSLYGLRMTDVEIDGAGKPDVQQYNLAAIGVTDYSCTRCHVHNTGRGANIGPNTKLVGSYIHDFTYVAGAHQTAAGSHGGDNIEVIHNNLQCNSNGEACSSALSFYGDDAVVGFDPAKGTGKGILVQNNLFNSDGSYCTYGGSVRGKPNPQAYYIKYIDNLFGKKFGARCAYYGPVANFNNSNEGNVWSGNRWQDGSGPVDASY